MDGVMMFYDEIDSTYSVPRDGGGLCVYIESKNPHIVAQITNSIDANNT